MSTTTTQAPSSAAPIDARGERPFGHLSVFNLWRLMLDAGNTKKTTIVAKCQQELELRRYLPRDAAPRQRIDFQLRATATTEQLDILRLVAFVRAQFGLQPLSEANVSTIMLNARGGIWVSAAAPLQLELLEASAVDEILRISKRARIEVRFIELAPPMQKVKP